MVDHLFKTFLMDRLARDFSGKPLGRVVLAGNYVEGSNIAVAILEIFGNSKRIIRGEFLFIDGVKYMVPKDLPDSKINTNNGKLMVNNFYLTKV